MCHWSSLKTHKRCFFSCCGLSCKAGKPKEGVGGTALPPAGPKIMAFGCKVSVKPQLHPALGLGSRDPRQAERSRATAFKQGQGPFCSDRQHP